MAAPSITQILQQAIAYHQAGRLPQAEALYRDVLARDPGCVTAFHYLGVIAHQVRRHDVAVALIAQAAALAPADPAIHSNLGEAYRHLHRLDEAVASFRRALALRPNYPDALNNLGNALTAQGRTDEAVTCFRKALALQPDSANFHYNLGIALIEQKQFGEAMARFQSAIALKPDFTEAHNSAGSLFRLLGRIDDAVASFRKALALQPEVADSHYNLGVALTDQDQFDEAVACFERAIALKPDFANAQNNLGKLFKDRGRIPEAFACFRRAIALQPDSAEAHNNLGDLFRIQGQFDDALVCFRQALALKPSLAEVHNNLGVIYKHRGQLDDALDCFQQALALKPDFADSHNNLGNLLKDQGRVDAAVACYRHALALKPGLASIHSNLIAALNYLSDDTGLIDRELCLWNQQHARPLTRFILPHSNERSPGRRLRIGYVSPDFCQHAVGLNLLPLLQQHDHDQFEIFCYADPPRPDRLTEKLRACANGWRVINSLSDSELPDLIRQDQIDILVDLALHTANNRLLAFACKPAPIQVSFAGYPGRSGLETIDYHLTDPYLTPPVSGDESGPDVPFRLPDTFWCYDPQTTDRGVNSLPALANGHLTFGCLNNFCKVNPAVLQLWVRTLSALPGSRLLLLTAEGRHRARTLDLLAQGGVSPNRIEFVCHQPREKYLALYQRIDLGLDTFPYNGHTTSLDSYWMGVPVVTLIGRTSFGRAGWSQLSNLGLTELAAHTPDEFVAISVALARDLARLAALRASLRERMQRSALMNASRFARQIEAAYRTMWHRWCERPVTHSFQTRQPG